MRYENPLYLAEELAALDLLADQRLAIGVSRGSPEPSLRSYETFGYIPQPGDEQGASMAREKFLQLISAIRGEGLGTAAPLEEQYPQIYQPGSTLPIMPHSPGLDRRIWWGAASEKSAIQAAYDGVNLMSSTLVFGSGKPLNVLQAEHIHAYRDAWKEAGHKWNPRVSISRSIFPVTNERERELFSGGQTHDEVGIIDNNEATFGRVYVDTPDKLVEQLLADEAVQAADTLLLTIPNQVGVKINVDILRNFAEHVAPALGWEPAQNGLASGYPIG